MSNRGPNFNVVSLERGDGTDLLVSIDGPTVDNVRHRGGHHLQVVLDVGETMHRQKLFPALRGVDYLVSQLPEGNTFGLVTFGSTNEVAFPAGRVQDISTVREVLGGIRSFGPAEPLGGLLMGIRECQRIGAGNASIVLISDAGLMTDSQRDRQMLIGLAGSALKQEMPVSTICMDPRPAAILMQLAHRGGGQATQAADGSDTSNALKQAVPGLLEKRFRGVSLTLDCMPDVASIETSTKLPSSELEDGTTYELGGLGEGECRGLDFRLEIPELAGIGTRKVAELRLRFTDMAAKRTQTVSTEIWVNALGESPGGGTTERSTEMEFSGPKQTERVTDDDRSEGLPSLERERRNVRRPTAPSAGRNRMKEIIREEIRLEVEKQLGQQTQSTDDENRADSNQDDEDRILPDSDGSKRPPDSDVND